MTANPSRSAAAECPWRPAGHRERAETEIEQVGDGFLASPRSGPVDTDVQLLTGCQLGAAGAPIRATIVRRSEGDRQNLGGTGRRAADAIVRVPARRARR